MVSMVDGEGQLIDLPVVIRRGLVLEQVMLGCRRFMTLLTIGTGRITDSLGLIFPLPSEQVFWGFYIFI